MQADTNFAREFLSELNKVVTQDDWNKFLYDLITPIRNLLLAEKDILTYSIARYSGADSKLAFFCEWFFQANNALFRSEKLAKLNQDYFRKKVPIRLRGVPNLFDQVENDIRLIFQPRQIILMQTKAREFMEELAAERPFLSKYFSKDYLAKIDGSELISAKYLYQENLPISQYIEAQGLRSSFVKIGFPALLGLQNSFNQPSSKIQVKSVRWVLVEEVLKGISALHQTGTSKDFQIFVYGTRLSEKDEFYWLQKNFNQRMQEALSSSEAREIVRDQRHKMYLNTKNNLENVMLPDKFTEMLGDLINWTYSLGETEINK